MAPASRQLQRTPALILICIIFLFLATPTEAFGAGYVSRGSHLKGTRFRHGDIALTIPLLATANRRLVKQIYFGNWLRDFSQIVDKGSLSVIPRPVLRALVGVFAFVQFGYATREFEVTDERLGFYRPEEHVDNPKGYEGDSDASFSLPQPSSSNGESGYRISEGLRPAVNPTELDIDPETGMKNYIANSSKVGDINPTSADYVEKQLIAAIACGRQGNQEAYIHLGAALHTLEDFLAHSNYVELAMRMMGSELQDKANITLSLGQVFTFVGSDAEVETSRGMAPPMTTGTFGALDLYLTLLGEIDDKLQAMSLPGLKARTSEKSGALQDGTKYLIGLLGGLTPNFEKDLLKVSKTAMSSEPISWGELDEKPEKLWASLEPVFKLRDDVVKWVYDHLTVPAVQRALAAISTAIDKLVYMVLGIVLGPILSELSKVLNDEKEKLEIKDHAVRLAEGEESIFDAGSSSTNPTHSQLAKDHYDHVLNEIAGRVAVCVSSYTTETVIHLWQSGNVQDPRPSIQQVLETFHHPYNADPKSAIQTAMLEEVRTFVNDSLQSRTKAFEEELESLSKSAIAARVDSEQGVAHTHHSTLPPKDIDSTPESQDTEQRPDFLERLGNNIKGQLQDGAVKGFGVNDMPAIQESLSKPPSSDSPNPLDSALAALPGIGFLSTFDGIEISEIASVDGMGETLKDAILSLILLDETRGDKEETVAAAEYGRGRNQSKEMERQKLKQSKELLKIQRVKTQQDEKQFDEKKSAGDRLKGGFEKLKMKASNKS